MHANNTAVHHTVQVQYVDDFCFPKCASYTWMNVLFRSSLSSQYPQLVSKYYLPMEPKLPQGCLHLS